ncbi:MAG: GNAT family N-acetyltransferase [Bosea sp. (in: a-proteobacteria)]
MSGTVTIRRATPSDLPMIRALLVETWHDTYDPIYGAARVTEITGNWHSISNLAAQLEVPNTVFLVAEVGEKIVGTSKATLSQDGTMVLSRLYVLPTMQRHGVGGKLFGVTVALAGHPATVTLEVEPLNARAIAFYQKLGFEVIGSVAECGGTNSGAGAAHLMTRSS